MSRRDLASRYWEAYESSLAPPPGSAARNLAAVQRRIRAGEEVELASRSVATPRRPRPACCGGARRSRPAWAWA